MNGGLRLCVVMGGLMVGACAMEAPAPEEDSAVQESTAGEVASRVARYLDAIQTGDVEAAADYWTVDARLVGPGMNLDRTTVLDGMRSVFKAGTRVEVLRRTTLDLFVHEDVAYEIAEAEEVFLSGTEVPPDTTRNNMFIRWERGGDGLWRFDRVLLSPQAPAQ